MSVHSLILAVAAVVQSPQVDTQAFATPAIRELVERATARRHVTDSAVTDYRATVQYRLSLGFGRRRWARIPPAVVEEQAGQVQWQLPNDLRVDIAGRRSRSRSDVLQIYSVFDRPWFVPRGVGDSVRIFSNDFPATGALHPLSSAGPAWYRYTRVGAVGLTLPDGRPLRLIELEVRPRRTGPALIAGRLLIDSASAEVVRMTFEYVGTALWARVGDPETRDSAAARRVNAIANRVLTINADIEYALQDGKYWMPYKQAVFGTARIPIISDLVIPFRATTVFDDYEINTGKPVAFALPVDQQDKPDSAASRDRAGHWPGGHYELHRASDDSLAGYTGWPAPLTLENPADEDEHLRDVEGSLAELAEDLPGELTGRRDHGIGYERLADVLQYNRVQGLAFGLGYRMRVPMARFTSAYTTIGYGLSDQRVTGRLALVSDAPGMRFSVAGYRQLQSVDPFAPAGAFENSLNALFAGHDNADYALATGGTVRMETSLGIGFDITAGVRVERQQSVAREAESAVNDFLGGSGIFPPNPAIQEGTFGGAFVRLDRFGAVRWTLTADVLGTDGEATGRLYGDVRHGFGRRRGVTLEVKAGIATEPTLPQMLYRFGGLSTVRGYEYGVQDAPAFWAAQLDITPFSGLIRPVLFLDGGQAGRARDLWSDPALVGGGVGLSLLRGWIRFDFSVPIAPEAGGKVRFDLIIRGAR